MRLNVNTMAYSEEMVSEKLHEAQSSSRDASLWGIAGTLLGIAGTATGITALATKVPKNGNNHYGHHGGGGAPTAFEAWEKSCEDQVALTAAIYQSRITELNEAREAREIDINEKFNLYKSQIDADFGLYKTQRDGFDVLAKRIGDLETQVAVSQAIRPYQDALINCKIEKVADFGNFNLWKRTCRMIEGEVVLPNTPTVTGFQSANGCNCNTEVSGS